LNGIYSINRGGQKSLVFPAFIAFREYFPPAEPYDFELFWNYLVHPTPFSRRLSGFSVRLLPFCRSSFSLFFPFLTCRATSNECHEDL
jgi:hypothetical protein